jgi:hypothetical protein
MGISHISHFPKKESFRTKTSRIQLFKTSNKELLGPLKVPQKYEKGLGPVHKSTRPVEMLSRVQKLYKTRHVAASQQVQCSYALDPSHFPKTLRPTYALALQ